MRRLFLAANHDFIDGEESYQLLMPIRTLFMDFTGDFRGFRPNIAGVLIPHMRSGEKGEGRGGGLNCECKLCTVYLVLLMIFPFSKIL